MTLNVFGPQNSNASTTLPPGTTTVRYGTNPTWAKDCDASGKGGTKLDAAFYNNIIGNLNLVVANSGVPSARGDMTNLYRAICATAAAQSTVTVTGLFGTPVGKVVAP
jgi:hypothetical protein